MEETPKKGIEEKEPEQTGVKAGEESHYQGEESYQKVYTSDETLDHIEGEIRQLSERLVAISEEKRKAGEGSEQFERLEDERRVLRKEIIDLDYHHKITMIERKKEKEAERQEQQHVPTPADPQTTTGEQGETADEKKNSEEERNIAEDRYNARIREIEVELAASRLRRSRQIQLEADLVSIRSLTPYYWWRYYDRPYYPLYRDSLYYPLYRDPLYYPSLYPSSLYYPYSYSSLYPYGLYI